MKALSKKEYSKKMKCKVCQMLKRKWCDCLLGNYRKWLGVKRYGCENTQDRERVEEDNEGSKGSGKDGQKTRQGL